MPDSRMSKVLVHACVWLCLLLDAASAGVEFRAVRLELEGIPANLHITGGVAADVDGDGLEELVLSGMWEKQGFGWFGGSRTKCHELLIMARVSAARLSAARGRLEERLSPDRPSSRRVYPQIQSLSVCDMDGDGAEEVLVGRSDPVRLTATGWRGGKVSERALQLPELARLSVLPFDYDMDGDSDVMIEGSKPRRGESWHEWFPPTIYRNETGALKASSHRFPTTGGADQMHLIDFNDDGFPDLLFRSGTQRESRSWLFLNLPSEGAQRALEAGDGEDARCFRPVPQVSGVLKGITWEDIAEVDLETNGENELVFVGYKDEHLKRALLVLRRAQAAQGWTVRTLVEPDRLGFPMPGTVIHLLAHDLDLDGDPDVLVYGRTKGDGAWKLVILENLAGRLEAADAVSGPARTAILGNFTVEIIPVDVDGDGRTDLVCFPENKSGRAVLLRNISRTPPSRS